MSIYKTILLFFVTLFLFSCASTSSKIKVNKFMDPDTGVETIESIISFGEGEDQTLISFNQTKNPRSISWYVICKFCQGVNEDFASADIFIDEKDYTFDTGGSFNNYDLKTTNSNIFRQVDYFKIGETVIAELSNCNDLKLRFSCKMDTIEFVFDTEQKDAVKDWVRSITIPK